jgi:hypothetical protein
MRARRRAAPPIRPNLSFSVHTGVNILLHPTDTKAKRAESFRRALGAPGFRAATAAHRKRWC